MRWALTMPADNTCMNTQVIDAKGLNSIILCMRRSRDSAGDECGPVGTGIGGSGLLRVIAPVRRGGDPAGIP